MSQPKKIAFVMVDCEEVQSERQVVALITSHVHPDALRYHLPKPKQDGQLLSWHLLLHAPE